MEFVHDPNDLMWMKNTVDPNICHFLLTNSEEGLVDKLLPTWIKIWDLESGTWELELRIWNSGSGIVDWGFRIWYLGFGT